MLTRRKSLGLIGVAAVLPAFHAMAAEKMVRIGAAVSLTGHLSHEGNRLKKGYVYWEKVVSAAGGIEVGGHKLPVKVFYYDDESNAQTSARLTERCITEDKVGAMFGPYSSGIATATAAISEKYRIPTIAAMATADSLYHRGYHYIFCPTAPASKTMDPLFDLLKSVPAPPKTVAIAGPDSLFPNVYAAAAAKKARTDGFDVIYNRKYPTGAVDLSSVATALKERNPDVVILTGYVQDSVLMVKTMQSLHVNPKLICFAFAVGIPDVLNALGQASEDLVGTELWEPSLTYKGPVIPDGASYVKGFGEMFGSEPDYVSAGGTASGIVLQQGIQNAGSTDPVKVRDAIASLDFETFYGKVKFNAEGIDVAASAVAAQVQNGKAIPVFPRDVAQAAFQYPRKPFPR
ncbi:MAG: amino acid ABC transporter substrate-binding protein [Acetobacteraceae bacterium]